jgi:hypothetical protein
VVILKSELLLVNPDVLTKRKLKIMEKNKENEFLTAQANRICERQRRKEESAFDVSFVRLRTVGSMRLVVNPVKVVGAYGKRKAVISPGVGFYRVLFRLEIDAAYLREQGEPPPPEFLPGNRKLRGGQNRPVPGNGNEAQAYRRAVIHGVKVPLNDRLYTGIRGVGSGSAGGGGCLHSEPPGCHGKTGAFTVVSHGKAAVPAQ